MVSGVTSSTGSDWTSLQRLLYNSDTNADGVVSKTELATALTSDSDAVTELVSAADSDGDSKVSLAEFTTFADQFSSETGLALLSAQDVGTAASSLFASMDSDGDASLSSTELTDGLTAVLADSDSTTTSSTTTTTDDETTTDDDDSDDSSDVAYTDATGTTYTKEQIASIIATVDANGDSKFDSTDVASMLIDQTLEDAADSSSSSKDTSILSVLQAQYKVADEDESDAS